MAKNIDWIAIKNEYVNAKPKISYRKLAEKHSVPLITLSTKAKKENWVELREKQYDKTSTNILQKTAEKIIEAEVDRVANLLNLTDKAQEQIAVAFGQLNRYMDMFGNVHNTEMVDVPRLKKLVSALKDIKDILHEDRKSENADVLAKLDEVIGEVDKLAE